MIKKWCSIAAYWVFLQFSILFLLTKQLKITTEHWLPNVIKTNLLLNQLFPILPPGLHPICWFSHVHGGVMSTKPKINRKLTVPIWLFGSFSWHFCLVHLPGHNIFCPGKNVFCPDKNFYPRLKSSYLLRKRIRNDFLAMEKILSVPEKLFTNHFTSKYVLY